MKHCVATYASCCARGHCSIWTMEIESFDGTAKGANRLPTDKERGIIRRWAAQAGLKIVSYV